MIGLVHDQALQVGDELPPLTRGPITRATLALFAGASFDHMELHIDSDFARAAGMPDVFAHGMLGMAYLAQLLTGVVPQERIRQWNVRFLAITPVHAVVHCTGRVVELIDHDGEACARVALAAAIQTGQRTLEGEAIVSLGTRQMGTS